MMHENGHRAHPVRNFFYTLYSLLNIFAFATFFCALAQKDLPLRPMLLVVAGTFILLALFFGVLRPLFRIKHR